MKQKNFDIPVVLFTFKRLETVQLIVEQIKKVEPQVIYIFSDGARAQVEGELARVEEVRDYLNSSIDWKCEKNIVFSENNKGCDCNIRDGLDEVFSKESQAIVFEDDAVPIPEFFSYCRELLEKYKDEKKVQYIAGFNAIGDNDIIIDDYTFGKTVPMSGAFATWSDRWNECDFKMANWPHNRDTKRFDSIFFSSEMKKKYIGEFNDAYSGKITAWDYIFEHDMMDKNRVAVVPKWNLATSYGYMDGAFHPQEKKEAAKLLKIMSRTDTTITFPLNGPTNIIDNVTYNKERQKKMLSVKGNILVRAIKRMGRKVKEWLYNNLPKNIWNYMRDMYNEKI